MVSEKGESGGTLKKPLKKGGFSYLFSRAERYENYQCGHCKKDVLISEAVSCQFCEGFFHKRHVKRSPGLLTAECTYTCHKCQGGKFMKFGTKQGKAPIQKSEKVSNVGRVVQSINSKKKAGKNKQTAKSQAKKNSSAAVPLRRSTRKIKYVSLQNRKPGAQKKKKQIKSKKKTAKQPKGGTWQKERTKTYHSFWLRGLQLSNKPNDERVMQFSSKKLLVSSEQLCAILDQPKCSLCCEQEFSPKLNYIGCEICGGWFHGDAFGLNLGNMGNLIGFKCYRCLNKIPPVCPHANSPSNDQAQLGKISVNEVIVEERSHSDEESKRLFLIDESSRDDQYVEPNPISNEKTELDAENRCSLVRKQQEVEELTNANEKDGESDVLLC